MSTSLSTETEVVANPELVTLTEKYLSGKSNVDRTFELKAAQLQSTLQLSRSVLIASLKAGGFSKGSAETRATQINNLAQKPEVMAKLEKKEITVIEARKEASGQTGTGRTATDPKQVVRNKLADAAKSAAKAAVSAADFENWAKRAFSHAKAEHSATQVKEANSAKDKADAKANQAKPTVG